MVTKWIHVFSLLIIDVIGCRCKAVTRQLYCQSAWCSMAIGWQKQDHRVLMSYWINTSARFTYWSLVTVTLKELSSIKDRGQTDHVTALPCPYTLDVNLWPCTVTLTFNPRQAVVIRHTQTQSQVQRSVSSKDRVETDRQMDAADCFAFPANAVGNYLMPVMCDYFVHQK